MPAGLETDPTTGPWRPIAPHSPPPLFPGEPWQPAGREALHVGLVNNMPDAALLRTERQFVELLGAATHGLPVRVTLHALPAVPRTDWGRQHVADAYAPADDLWRHPPDAIVVTGTEPRARNLKDEPYWSALAGLIDWARSQAIPAMFSCLAAHVAVLHADAVAREPLAAKCFGVFDHDTASADALMQGTGARMWLPHSRWNQVSETALTAAGYRILSRCDEAGVGFFAKEGRAPWLFCQGHPEYDGANLLREYRRDIRRFLRGERPTYPELPRHYFGAADTHLVTAFKQRALAHRGNAHGGNAEEETLMAAFPPALGPGPTWDAWRPAAVRIVRNWLDCVGATKTQSRSRAMAMLADW